ncbi:MAG: bile acid:sodium symporter [Bacteroidales bacterium]|nr:bile acid:sodium symporter [Bacteroidales bacterium]
MKFSELIEKYFWLILIAGIVIGIWKPLTFTVPPFLPKLILGIMLFIAFLKIDALEILENMKNYKLMIYVTVIYMLIIPLCFYFLIKIFDNELAIGILLLTSMPAGVSTPALVDIARGNISLSMSLVITTQMVAPFTVPLLFLLLVSSSLPINKILLFKDIAILVFLPMILSRLVRTWFPALIRKTQHFFTSANVLLLFAFVYITISSQSYIILANPSGLIWRLVILYLVFTILHVVGYLIGFKEKRKERISIAIGAAYMNNGMAVVLAVSYFKPEILILMILSEIPWSTLLAPFKKVISNL